jgi:hypothetical protein
MIMTATIKRIATRWTLPALVLIAGGFVCDGLTEVGHHAFLIAGGIALGIGIGRESRQRLRSPITKSVSMLSKPYA